MGSKHLKGLLTKNPKAQTPQRINNEEPEKYRRNQDEIAKKPRAYTPQEINNKVPKGLTPQGY